MDKELRKVIKEINEYGEVERDCAQIADECSYGGLWYRFFKWIERKARNERLALIDEREDIKRRTP